MQFQITHKIHLGQLILQSAQYAYPYIIKLIYVGEKQQKNIIYNFPKRKVDGVKHTIVSQHYVVEVYDEFVPPGSTAVLRCHIPGFMEEYVSVMAWREEPTGKIIQPSASLDKMFTKYQMIKFVDFYEMCFLPESVARVAAIVGDHRCHTPRH
ncbi:hypothetical protein TNCV_3873191 [Trichonephila clavipes]|nr:hypothetical protein TNCV_3873191 [Trichonephila clavipes]